jgi:hypothetical protein
MTQDDIIRMAREAGLITEFDTTSRWIEDTDLTPYIERFAKLVAEHEREVCAKLCDQLSSKHTWEGCYANECAEEIRARGNK